VPQPACTGGQMQCRFSSSQYFAFHCSGLRFGLFWLTASTVPTMPSADFSWVVNASCPSFSASLTASAPERSPEVRHGSFTARAPNLQSASNFADGGLRSHVPARPECTTPTIRFLFIAPQLWVRLLSDPASRRRPCRFPSLRLCLYLAAGLPPT
jgi:hypothetical protein